VCVDWITNALTPRLTAWLLPILRGFTHANSRRSTKRYPSTNSSFEHLSLVQVTLTPAIVATITTAVQTFTVTGLSVGDSLQVQTRF